MREAILDPLVFRSLFEATHAPSIAVRSDAPRFTIVAASLTYLRMAGASSDQVTGQPLFDTEPYRQMSGSRVQSLRTMLEGSATTTATASKFVLTIDSDGCTWEAATAPIFDANGKLAMVLFNFQQPSDGTNSGHHENSSSETSIEELASTAKVAVIHSHARRSGPPQEVASTSIPSREVFEKAVPGFAVFDLEGKIIDCNPAFAKIVGRSREELQQLNSAILIHPDDLGRSEGDVQKLITGKSSAFVIEKRYVRPDGTIVWVRNSVSLIRAAEGRPQQLVTISEDLTLLRMAERALIKNEKLAAVGRLSASIVHELNNPLEAVTNLLFLIGHSSEMDEIRRYGRLAEQELARVTQIATQTLRFYRHEAAPAPVQMADILESVLALFEGRLHRRKISIVRCYSPAANPLLAYSGEIRQVFVNLISNALDAMGDTGKLHIDVRNSRVWDDPEITGVRVTICDTGSGIPRDMMKRIFEPFVSTKESNGTGLGLWISKEIIRRHGGTLNVRSSVMGPWRGTVMSVFLPQDVIAAAA